MIILDTETTDLLKPDVADLAQQPHIIEIALMRLDEESYQEVERFESLLRPGAPLDEEAHKRITGLTNAELEHQPTFLELYAQLADFLLGEQTMIAHNMSFDLGVLTVELRRIEKQFAFPYPPNQICTVDRTKHIKGRRLRLIELYELKLGKPLKQTHRAMDDVVALAEVVRAMKIKS